MGSIPPESRGLLRRRRRRRHERPRVPGLPGLARVGRCPDFSVADRRDEFGPVGRDRDGLPPRFLSASCPGLPPIRGDIDSSDHRSGDKGFPIGRTGQSPELADGSAHREGSVGIHPHMRNRPCGPGHARVRGRIHLAPFLARDQRRAIGRRPNRRPWTVAVPRRPCQPRVGRRIDLTVGHRCRQLCPVRRRGDRTPGSVLFARGPGCSRIRGHVDHAPLKDGGELRAVLRRSDALPAPLFAARRPGVPRIR